LFAYRVIKKSLHIHIYTHTYSRTHTHTLILTIDTASLSLSLSQMGQISPTVSLRESIFLGRTEAILSLKIMYCSDKHVDLREKRAR